ncbi:MAG: hypothetical protein NTU83_05165, partial [Candidatus Hydrogenedentes bacterium]|nr:hypothetical protein [Candidatus Hydrogenedentota bacterium]
MRNLLVYMLIAVAGLALTGCPLQVGGPWEFSVSDTNAPDDPLGDFTGMWRFYSDGTMVIRNNHLVFLQGIYTDDGTTIDFQVDRSRSTSLNGHEVVEYYWLSGTLTY